MWLRFLEITIYNLDHRSDRPPPVPAKKIESIPGWAHASVKNVLDKRKCREYRALVKPSELADLEQRGGHIGTNSGWETGDVPSVLGEADNRKQTEAFVGDGALAVTSFRCWSVVIGSRPHNSNLNSTQNAVGVVACLKWQAFVQRTRAVRH